MLAEAQRRFDPRPFWHDMSVYLTWEALGENRRPYLHECLEKRIALVAGRNS